MNEKETKMIGTQSEENERFYVKFFTAVMTAGVGLALAITIVGTALAPVYLTWKTGDNRYLLLYPLVAFLLFSLAPKKM